MMNEVISGMKTHALLLQINFIGLPFSDYIEYYLGHCYFVIINSLCYIQVAKYTLFVCSPEI